MEYVFTWWLWVRVCKATQVGNEIVHTLCLLVLCTTPWKGCIDQGVFDGVRLKNTLVSVSDGPNTVRLILCLYLINAGDRYCKEGIIMVHIFIHHIEDAQGHALAALIKQCDALTHRQFKFLVVDGPDSIDHMNRFLQQQGLSRKTVQLPFVVLVRNEGQTTHRSVLHGAPLNQWLAEMIEAFLATPTVNPIRVKQTFLDPFISPHLLRLMQYATSTTESPVVESMHNPTPPPPAYIEELPDNDMATDGYDAMSYSTTPAPKPGTTKTRRSGVVADPEYIQSLKARENMVKKQGKGGDTRNGSPA